MRQWHVPPQMMCRQHLLGEHVEHHMIVSCILAGKSIAGYLRKGLIAPCTLKERHDAIVVEMARRGYKHASPLVQPPIATHGCSAFNPDASLADLLERCPSCRSRAVALLHPEWVN